MVERALTYKQNLEGRVITLLALNLPAGGVT